MDYVAWDVPKISEYLGNDEAIERKTMPNQNPPPDEFAAFIGALFESVATG